MIRLLPFVLIGLVPGAAHAHVPYEDPGAWTYDPWGLVPLGLAAVLYGAGIARLWRRAGAWRGVPRWRAASFAAGLVFAVLAVASPIDALADQLFSLHMVQHLLLMLVAAPLVVLSRPGPAMLFALPRRWRGPVGRLGNRAPGTLWRVLTHPLGAAGAYLVTLWVWHVPALYEAAIHSDPVHAVQHATFFLAAVCLWTSVVDRSRRVGDQGAGVLAIFATAVHSSALGALLALSTGVWYPFYAERARLVESLTDQQLGGLVMWVPSGIILAGAGLVSFAAWLSLAGRRAERMSALRRGGATSLAILAAVVVTGCAPSGDDGEARALIHAYGCGSCHVIPDVPGANGRSGPPLTRMAEQAYIAGVLPNREDALVRFIVDPQAVDPRSAMPDVDATAEEARTIARFLYRVGRAQ